MAFAPSPAPFPLSTVPSAHGLLSEGRGISPRSSTPPPDTPTKRGLWTMSLIPLDKNLSKAEKRRKHRFIFNVLLSVHRFLRLLPCNLARVSCFILVFISTSIWSAFMSPKESQTTTESEQSGMYEEANFRGQPSKHSKQRCDAFPAFADVPDFLFSFWRSLSHAEDLLGPDQGHD